MTAKSVFSYTQPKSKRFTIIVRGDKVLLGNVNDIREGDLHVCGFGNIKSLQISRFGKDLDFVLLGGHWAQRFVNRRLTLEDINRVKQALVNLSVDQWFIDITTAIRDAHQASKACPNVIIL